MTFKATGLLAGVSDLIIVLKNETIYCEVKTEKGNQSDEQEKFQKIIEELGHKYILVRSLEDFINQLKPKL